jgi:phospholipid/cholesterol/gamma-HCH transport system substrate-binding protein
MSRLRLPHLRLAALMLAATAALSGCGFKGAYSLPLPGGNAGGDNYHVVAVFDDVQDLVPMSAVRVNDVAVGDVTDIKYDPADGKAHVELRLRDSVELPANSTATLEQTTLLGEKYVALAAPIGGTASAEPLVEGSVIEANATSNLPDVEEVFGVLSAVLNGGDLQDLQTINLEIGKALTGREQDVKSALRQLTTFVSGLDDQKQEIVRALDELDRFSGALAGQTGTIATALDDLGPGLEVLADERAKFTELLTDLARFGDIATRIITASRKETVAGLRDLRPVLQHLRAAGTNLPRALELLITYPFPKNIDKAIPGDYNGLHLSFNADPIFCAMGIPLPPGTLSCNNMPGALGGTGTVDPQQPRGGDDSDGGDGVDVPGLPGLDDVPAIPTPLPTADDFLDDLLGGAIPGGLG